MLQGNKHNERKLIFLRCCPTEVVKALTFLYQQRELVLSQVVPVMPGLTLS